VLIFLKLSIDVENALAPHKVECFGKSEQLEKGILPILYALAKSQVYCFLLNLLMVRTLSSLLNNYLMSVSPPLSRCDLAKSHQIITNHDPKGRPLLNKDGLFVYIRTAVFVSEQWHFITTKE